jgi:hypothetical protein
VGPIIYVVIYLVITLGHSCRLDSSAKGIGRSAAADHPCRVNRRVTGSPPAGPHANYTWQSRVGSANRR